LFESLTAALTRALEKFRAPGKLTEQNVEEGLRAVRQALLGADVHFRVARELVDRVRSRAVGEEVIRSVTPSQQIVKLFHDELVEALGGKTAALALPERATLLLAGLQGSGKTTTAAKLAAHFASKGRRPLLVAADLKRPGAAEQLRTLGERAGIPVYAEESARRAPAVCARALERARESGADLVVLDTAGRLHVDEEMMEEIAQVREATRPDRVLLVLDAMTGQDAVSSAKAFADRLGLDGVLLTKLDGDARGGAALSVRNVVGVPILFVGVGEKLEDFEPFHPERMASRILGMGDVVTLVEKAQAAMDEEEAAAAAERILEGSFTLEDLQQNLQRMRKLGPLRQVVSLLPGAWGSLLDQVDEKAMRRTEAVFQSMTPHERRHPEILDGSRRARIARGSGNPVSAVNDLLRAHRAMQKQMKSFRGLLAGKSRRQLLDSMKRMAPPGGWGSGLPGAGAGGN
jgi:signal recognition particle subunit SRP54